MIIAIYEKKKTLYSALKSVKKFVKSLFTKRMYAKKKFNMNNIIKNLANTNLPLHFLFKFGAL